MEAEAALLAGARHVDAVDIDPGLIRLVRRFNAGGIYDHPLVSVHAEDARAFIRRAKSDYDIIAFGYLDSQALFSSMSNIRLDGFVYTVESLRTAYDHLRPQGLLCLSFAVDYNPLMASKLYQMVLQATGHEPLVYVFRQNLVFCVPRNPIPEPPLTIGPFQRMRVNPLEVAVPTDDWPYLYLFGHRIPSDYLIVMGVLLVGTIFFLWRISPGGWGAERSHFLFLGMGFLLLQTKSIVDCSLYFGSTWLVTTLIIAGVLLMALAANTVAARGYHLWPVYGLLFATLFLLYVVPRDWILSLPWMARLAWTLLVVPLPVFFAGFVFASSLRAASNPSAAFGANLVGATLGGFSEYLGMVIGYRRLSWVLIGAYALSAYCRKTWQGLRSPSST